MRSTPARSTRPGGARRPTAADAAPPAWSHEADRPASTMASTIAVAAAGRAARRCLEQRRSPASARCRRPTPSSFGAHRGRRPQAEGQVAARSVAEQGADAAEHVEVGVAAADLDLAPLGQRLVDGLLDDVVELAASSPSHAGSVRPDGGEQRRTRRTTSPASRVAVGHEQVLDPALVERARARRRARRRPGGRSRPRRAGGSTSAASLRRSCSASTASAAVRTSSCDAPGCTSMRPHSRSRRYGCSSGSSSLAIASGAPMTRCSKPLLLEHLERHVGGVAEVLVGQLLDVAAHVAPLAARRGCRSRGAARRTARSGRPARRARTRTSGPAAGRPAARRSGRAPGRPTRAGRPPARR